MSLEKVGGIHFGERVDIPDVAEPTLVYLRRWFLARHDLGAVMLHAIHMNDADRHLHDHPWDFVSIVLRGGYEEERPGGVIVKRRAGSVAVRRAEDLHRVRILYRCPTWTLVLRGRERREWGFLDDHGWVDHVSYIRRRRG